MLVGDNAIHAVKNPGRAYTGRPTEEPFDFKSVLCEFELAEERFSESIS